MAGFILRTIVTALGLWLAETLVPGVTIDTTAALIWAAVLLGIVNAFVRPLVIVLTLPITVVTLGLFVFVVNAGMFGLVAWMLDAFRVTGFFSALFGALLVSLTAWFASSFIGPTGRYEVLIVRRD